VEFSLDEITPYLRYLSRHAPSFYFLSSGEASLSPSPGKDVEKVPAAPMPSFPEDLDGLERFVRACQACSLSETRNQVVFGEGRGTSGLMFVGEGPGADEDRTGRPFVGRAGELLTKMIQAMGLSREEVYIANTVKCRPPGNRVPSPEERKACFPFLEAQIRLLKPKYMILLGQTAAQVVLRQSAGITRIRGTCCELPEYPGIKIMPTYHPAYLLRNPSAKRDVWSDLQTVMGWMGLSRSGEKEGK
jgi:DNA polymerase